MMVPEWLLNVWIVIMILFMAGWDQREDAVARWFIRPLLPLIRWTGLWHCWNMFAPNVSTMTFRAEVIVRFADGTSAAWIPPGWTATTRWGVFRRFRWRKTVDGVLGTEFQTMRPSVCRYGMDDILVGLGEQLRSVPTVVELVRIEEPILWPNEPAKSLEPKRTTILRMRVDAKTLALYEIH